MPYALRCQRSQISSLSAVCSYRFGDLRTLHKQNEFLLYISCHEQTHVCYIRITGGHLISYS